MTFAIETNELSKHYGGVRALNSVSLSIEQGTVTALLGPNGAGKTTLMEIIMGMRRPSSGRVRVVGCEPWGDPGSSWRKRIGYLPQEVVPIEYLTGLEYIQLITELYEVDPADVRQRLSGALEFFELGEAQTRRFGTYSTGMRKKTVLCALFVARPEILVLDEPFEGLDPHATRRLQRWIGDMARDGTTFLVSSHVIPLVETLANRVVVIDGGEVLHAGEVTSDGIPSADSRWLNMEQLYFSLVRGADRD